jgi:hypothetical protein
MLTYGAIAARYRPGGWFGRTSPASCPATEDGTLEPSSGSWANSGMGSPTGFLTLSSSEFPSDAAVCSLSDVLETGEVPQRYFLSATACRGILRRAEKRGKPIVPDSLCLNAHGGGRHDAESETLIPTNGGHFDVVAHTLRGDGFDASEDGTGRGTPLVPVAFDPTQITSRENRSNPQPGDPCHTLSKGMHAPAIAFNARQDPINGPINGPIDCNGASNGVMVPSMKVRRLMPVECERLMGFPDDYTAITYRGKPAADGPRYRALGNSWAVNCARWIGRRIHLLDHAALPASSLNHPEGVCA